MLRVGLTGSLGSGKSTAAKIFAALGAHVFSADEIARALMQSGEPVYRAIVETFGPEVVLPSGELDRPALARIAFAEGRLDELNAIVHPATIGRQAELAEAVFAADREAIVLVESALIFETRYSESKQGEAPAADAHRGEASPWRQRFDKLILVTAPEALRIERFITRTAAGRTLSEAERAQLEAEAQRRMDQQWPDDRKAALSDYVLTNAGAITELEWQIDQLWPLLVAASRQPRP